MAPILLFVIAPIVAAVTMDFEMFLVFLVAVCAIVGAEMPG